jgi:hypothetical protein
MAGKTFAADGKPLPQQKILTVILDNNGWICIGRDTLSVDKVAFEVQQRLWKTYLGTGKMQDEIVIQLHGDVLPTIQAAAKEAIQKGQEKALAEYCVMKYKKTFDKLNENQQSKVKRQYPVLFQQL